MLRGGTMNKLHYKDEERKEFVTEENREKYLRLCEEVFALAEDFNIEEHQKEALILKEAFREITKKLSDDDEEELEQIMNSRGL